MTYFKAVQKKKVVNIGSAFLKWNNKKHRLFICDVDDAEFVQSHDEEHVYHDAWMKPIPAEIGHEEAKIVIISEREYIDLLAVLNEGEEVEAEPVVQETVEEIPEPEEDKLMSIAEMREIISKQQEQIEMLIRKLS